MKHLLLTRGTSWLNLWDWRLRELRGDTRDWNLFTTSEPLAQYPSTLASV